MPSVNTATLITPDSPRTDSPTPAKAPASPLPHYETRIFTASELLSVPWLPALTQAINKGFSDNGEIIKFDQRLASDSQLSRELGEKGFTAVAFAPKSESQSSPGHEVDVIGTVSVKPWVNDRDWIAYPPALSLPELAAKKEEDTTSFRNGDQDPCNGDFEIALVTILPGVNFRKRGIADHLIRVCEDELIRRLDLVGDKRRSLRLMVKIVKEINAQYWLKKGFTTVGQKLAPIGTWDSFEEFTMWAMERDLVIRRD